MNLQAKPTMLDIVINTGPLIAMVAATGNLNWLPSLYGRIVIPYEVLLEIEAGGPGNLEIIALRAIVRQVLIGGQSTQIDAAMLRELDLGESSVISSALIHAIDTVAIDEKAGRRLARIHGLKVTGSIGILLKAKRHNFIPNLGECIVRMRARGIWISEELIQEVLNRANES
jgi:predicted nucleic acid-binding protein